MNAIFCTDDPRFPGSLLQNCRILYSAWMYSAAEPNHSPAQLDVKRYGVIVSKDYRRGLLLPNQRLIVEQ